MKTIHELFNFFLTQQGVCGVYWEKNFSPKERTRGCIFAGTIYPSLIAYASGDMEDLLCFAFHERDYAYFAGQEGTWVDIYNLIIEHIEKIFSIPEIPKKS